MKLYAKEKKTYKDIKAKYLILYLYKRLLRIITLSPSNQKL